MSSKIAKMFFGSRNDRLVKKKSKLVKKINLLEKQYKQLSYDDLHGKSAEFRVRLSQGESLDNLMFDAFAAVREAAVRVLGMRHFDVQLLGGMILNDAKIAEMKTGEGKTLVATLAVYLNALPGKGVHVVTVNDYLAQRDAAWMGKIYNFLGMTVGVIINELNADARREAYAADITYGTNNEYGFDYLRDNMAFSSEQKVQRGLHYAIIDEVDSILIDEARTPLIISGATDENIDMFVKVNALIPYLKKQEHKKDQENEFIGEPGDYTVDEKTKQVYLTEIGHENVENMLDKHELMASDGGLYDAVNIRLMHYVTAALRAHVLFHKDVDYIVKNNQVIIVDEFTGRTMAGRRWSDGLHQAMEAKEGVKVQEDNQTLAAITFQNYFRLYPKLAGMTGTADTEAPELQKIYGLEVVVIPTHMPMIRLDRGDLVYMGVREKYNAIIEDIKDCVERGQPVLIGTTSIENSEIIASELKKHQIKHEVLNAKQHEREAHIIEQAGMSGSVTIATNMAGRGTDIVLGGNLEAELKELGEGMSDERERVQRDWQLRHDKVLAAGGLHVIGSERHESRRIDNQLRGRSGRQGDPGSTRFYLSLKDDLMRIFASDKVVGMMQKLGMEDGEAIEHPWVTRAIENAQKKVEDRNYDIRKQILEYDDVANDQRKIIYGQRNDLMDSIDISFIINAFREDVVNNVITQYIPEQTMEEQWDIKGLEDHLRQEFEVEIPVQQMLAADHTLRIEEIRKNILAGLTQSYQAKEAGMSEEMMRHLEKSIMLQVLDNTWKEHLAAMDHLRQGIHLRGYAQKDPKQEFKRESFAMFISMLDFIKYEVIGVLSKVKVNQEVDVKAINHQRQAPKEMHFEHANVQALNATKNQEKQEFNAPEVHQKTEQPFVRIGKKVGRNQTCPCGSGKKYKQCHGQS